MNAKTKKTATEAVWDDGYDSGHERGYECGYQRALIDAFRAVDRLAYNKGHEDGWVSRGERDAKDGA